jgi:hypothetical protein
MVIFTYKRRAAVVKKILLTYVFFLFLFAGNASAHPGNTDAFGGHTCRTNCEQWGLNYGEYHYHDGSGGKFDLPDPQVDYDAGYDEGYKIAYGYTSKCVQDYEWNWQGTKTYGKGFEDGRESGHFEGLQVCFEESYAAGIIDGENESHEGVVYNENREIDNKYDADSYLKGYVAGYDHEAYSAAMEAAEEPVTADPKVVNTAAIETINSSDDVKDFEDSMPWKGFATVMAFVIGTLSISKYYDWKERKKDDK